MKRVHDQVRKMSVVGASGRLLGTVEDLEIDEATWRVTRLVVRVKSSVTVDLGIEKPFCSHALILIPVDQIAGTSDTIVLRSSADQIAQLLATADARDSAEG